MKNKNRQEIEKFVQTQKAQLGLDEDEAQNLLEQSIDEADGPQAPGAVMERAPAPSAKSRKRADPYLSESVTIHTRPSRVSKFRSLLYEFALPNEYIVQIGAKDAIPVLGGKFLKLGRRYLKFPATVQTVYFTSDNANKNYQGLRIDGYACWRVNPEHPEMAARSLDFSDQNNPMGNTNRILRTICTEAIRHIIANITIEESLTKKDEIGRNLKSQLERIERSWGISFDQVGIERVTILSASVFNDLQQKTRDGLRLTAAESRMETDQTIEKKKASYTEEMEALRCKTEKDSRILKAKTESEIHEVELEEKSEREAAERKAAEEQRKAEHEAEERAAEARAERDKRQAVRDAAIETLRDQEAHKLRLSKAEADAEARMKAAQTEAEVARVLAQTELAVAEAEHEKKMRQQALEQELASKALETEILHDEKRLAAEIRNASARLEQNLKEQEANAILEHETDNRRLERMKTEEKMLNQISENRLLSAFISQMPDIASSLKIDRYTVFSDGGDAPLTRTIAQMLSLFDDSSLKKFLTSQDESK